MRTFVRWDEVSDTESSNQVLLLLASWHLHQVQQPSEAFESIFLLWLEDDIRGLCLFELTHHGLSPHDFYHLRQCLAFFTKREDLELGFDREALAWEKFEGAERLCSETNAIFRSYSSGGFLFHPRVESVLFAAQRKISRILGDLPSLSELKLRFGPGATTQVKKKDASVRRKLAQKYTCNESGVRYLQELYSQVPSWSGFDPDRGVSLAPHFVSREVVEFVPKTFRIRRTITKAPTLDGFVQLGIGDFMADRLKRAGVDLRDQTRNQRLALEGSITGALATLDLSDASQTVAKGLVESLLPFDWWDFLRSFRSNEVHLQLNGEQKVVRLESFSSMGNGFTFPLETLIFYALASACVGKEDLEKTAVYGDDIIVPVYAVPLLIEVLTACGFVVNKKKSFWSGSFRESCGKDYLSGTDVRPCFIKAALSGETCFILHNFYVRTGQPEPAELVREFLDESLVLYGPDGYGDGHLIGDYTPQPLNRKLGWGGFTFETYTHKGRKALYELGADYVFPSYSIYIKGDSSYEDAPPVIDSNGDGWPKPSEFLRRLWLRDTFSALRPTREDAVYRWCGRKKRMMLEDTLPGTNSGYKRIKVYTW